MDDLFGALRDLILREGPAQSALEGFQLPPERELASRFNLQRSALREKLSALEHLGMLERKQGSGTFLRMPKADVIRLYFDLALGLGYVSLEELENARELLEREIAGRAASVGTEGDFDALEVLCEDMVKAQTVDQQLDADHMFHMRLAQAARNPVISLIFDGLSSVLRTSLARRRRAVRAVPDAAVRQNAAHPPIVAALRMREADKAMEAMDEHFRITNELRASVFALGPRRTNGLLAGAGEDSGARFDEAKAGRSSMRRRKVV